MNLLHAIRIGNGSCATDKFTLMMAFNPRFSHGTTVTGPLKDTGVLLLLSRSGTWLRSYPLTITAWPLGMSPQLFEAILRSSDASTFSAEAVYRRGLASSLRIDCGKHRLLISQYALLKTRISFSLNLKDPIRPQAALAVRTSRGSPFLKWLLSRLRSIDHAAKWCCFAVLRACVLFVAMLADSLALAAGSDTVVQPFLHRSMEIDATAQTRDLDGAQQSWLEYSFWQGQEWVKVYIPGNFDYGVNMRTRLLYWITLFECGNRLSHHRRRLKAMMIGNLSKVTNRIITTNLGPFRIGSIRVASGY